MHPVDACEDARVAAAALACAVAAMDGPLSDAELRAVEAGAADTFGVAPAEAAEIASVGRWLQGQCGNEWEAARRLGKRVLALAGAEAGPDLVALTRAAAEADGAPPTETQQEALRELSRRFSLN